MKKLAVLGLILLLHLNPDVLGLGMHLTLDDKVTKSDAVLRIRAVDVSDFPLNEGQTFTYHGIAKCEILEVYKGTNLKVGSHLMIPCNYDFDDSPSGPQDQTEYIAFLDIWEYAHFAHPISAYGLHEIQDGQIATNGYPFKSAKRGAKIDTVESFVDQIQKIISPKN